MAKRAATSELNHENWDKEEEAEEPGMFQKASAEVLESRVIRTAKRRVRMSDSSSDSKPSPFSGFTGFGNATSTTKSPFSFLNQSKDKLLGGSDKNETKPENSTSPLTKETQPQFKSFSNSFLNTSQQNNLSFSSSLPQAKPLSTDTTFKPFSSVFKTSTPSDEKENDQDKNSKNLELLKDLNLSCSGWIAEHLEKNPYCILTPIFKDYEKHLAQLDLSTHSDNKDIGNVVEKTNTNTNTNTKNNSLTQTANFFSPSKEKCDGSDPVEKEKEKEKEVAKEKENATGFKFEGLQPKPSFNFQFNSGSTTFGTSTTPFSLNQIAAKPVVAETEAKNDAEESDEPPKNEIVPVVEEDSIFDMKCKVFVKREGVFVSRGVGVLFLKPVKDSTKTQLIVRAQTNLGNIVLNTLLVPGMPIQKKGKNSAMIVCIPTPDFEPPPVPVVIRVKTSEECDSLIKKLEECRGS